MQANNDGLIGAELRGKYRIDKLIAKGGQGNIYHATDISSSIEKEYVVKEFSPNYGNTHLLEVGSRLFNQESEILQKLGKHSQIPQIFDYFETDRKFYLVQELIEGQNLEKELEEKQHLNETETIALLKDILNVLNFVHLNNYIHRDIKPSNLIRSKYDRKIFLIDFGAVKEKIQLENIEREDHTIAIGTPGYMPNEQKMGKPRFSSDIYAVGMVIIKALTGLNPNDLEYDDSNYNPIWRDRLPLGGQQYDPNLLNIIDKMVRNRYSDRYQSVREIIVELNNSLGVTQIPQKPTKEEKETAIFADDKNENPTRTETQNRTTHLSLIVGGVVATTIAISILLSNLLSEKYITYNQTEYGLKLELPQDWSIQENWMSLQPQVRFVSPGNDDNNSIQEEVIISIEDLSQPLSLNQYTEQSIAEIELYNNIITPVRSTTFANKEGRKIIYQAKDNNIQQMQVWTIKNQKAYIATYIAEPDNFDRYQKQAEKIIETLTIE